MAQRKSKRRVGIIVALVLVVCFAALGISVKILLQPVSKDDTISQEFVIESGQSLSRTITLLKQENLIKNKTFAYYYARLVKTQFKAGFYLLSPSMSLKEIFAELQTGKQKMIKLTVPEGLTITKIAQLLEDSNICNATDFLSLAQSGEILQSYGIDAATCEGFLYPDTYFFPDTGKTPETAESVLNFMVKTFFDKTAAIPGFPTEPTDIMAAVKLASIVEREYRVPDEAARIAGVFLNRLNIDMPLQSCTTIEYIITEVQHKPHPKRIYWVDLEIDNPYNSYIYKGLPPTPICNPGNVALTAVCQPEHHDYLYFRLADESTGRHSFSKTFYEHNTKGEGIKLK